MNATVPTRVDLDHPALTLDAVEAELWSRVPETLPDDVRDDVTAVALDLLVAAAQTLPGVAWWSPRARRLGVEDGADVAAVGAAVVAFVSDPPPGLLDAAARAVRAA